jgi:predicted CoA-substrate-specific enzyme activase
MGEILYGLGIDSGSTVTKGVLFDGERLVEKLLLPTSARPQQSLYEIYHALRPDDGPCCTVTTGYGRNLLSEADKTVTEITCHARGAAFLEPESRCVIDIGGQDCKAILLDRDQNVVDFLMNDKCAAGTGRFVEMMCRTLELEGQDLDAVVQNARGVAISSMCTVFAESEIVGLLAAGEAPADIALGVIASICRRTANFAQRLALEGTVYFSGGLSRYAVFRRLLEQELGRKVVTHPLGQYTGAVGAAVIAWDRLRRKQRA